MTTYPPVASAVDHRLNALCLPLAIGAFARGYFQLKYSRNVFANIVRSKGIAKIVALFIPKSYMFIKVFLREQHNNTPM